MITYKELSCANCNKSFRKRLSDYNYEVRDRGRTVFTCSRACTYDIRTHVMVSGTCEQCGLSFSRKSATKSREKGRFCSRTCSALFQSHQRKSLGLCKYCDNVIIGASTICEDCCEGNTIANRTLMELKNFYSISQYHAKIRGHARSIFKKSGRTLKCQACDYALHVDICHIKDVKDFELTSKLSEVNSLNNLTTLCKTHHWEFDHGYLKL